LTLRQRSEVTDLKRKGLVKTVKDEGVEFLEFTQAGIDLAKEMGVVIHVYKW